MINESKLKIGGRYLYWSPSKLCHVKVTFEGKRAEIFIFRDPLTLNEIWTENFINIVIDDDWLEKFVKTPEDEETA